MSSDLSQASQGLPSAGVSSLKDLCPALADGEGLLVLVAHPDDEVVGAGGQIPGWSNARFVQVTDGAPRNMSDAHESGFETRESYASARFEELTRALSLATIPSGRIRNLGFVDQEISIHLATLVEACIELFRAFRPEAILTQPYEGGHPDHDSTAFAVHAACRLLGEAGDFQPTLLEMTSYHNCQGSMQTRQFLPCPDEHCVTVRLGHAESALKQKMLDCFSTQRRVLQWFPVDCERFRLAPAYDFLQPPHEGTLYYELFNWGMTGPVWRRLARQTLTRLEQKHTAAKPSGSVPPECRLLPAST
jgi:LmbE family N-acetylglucosaminyl deacetylase